MMSEDATRVRIIVYVGAGFSLVCVLIVALFLLDRVTVTEIRDIVYIVGPTIAGFASIILSYFGLMTIGGDLRDLGPEMAKARRRVVLFLIVLLFLAILGAIAARGLGRLRFGDLKTILAIVTSGIAGLVSASIASFFNRARHRPERVEPNE